MLLQPDVHLLKDLFRLRVARAQEVDLDLVHVDLALRLFVQAAGEAAVVRMGVRQYQLRDVIDADADLVELLGKSGVGVVGRPSAIDEERLTAACDHVRHDVGQPLGHSRVLLHVVAQVISLFALEFGERADDLVDALLNALQALVLSSVRGVTLAQEMSRQAYRETGQGATASVTAPTTISAAPQMRDVPYPSRSTRTPSAAPSTMPTSRAGAT